MYSLTPLCLGALLASGGTADLVEERPPVDRAQVERHWRVDCGQTVLELRAAVIAYRESILARQELAGRLDGLLPRLRLCAHIDRREGANPSRFQGLGGAAAALRRALDASDPAASKERMRTLERMLDGAPGEAVDAGQ